MEVILCKKKREYFYVVYISGESVVLFWDGVWIYNNPDPIKGECIAGTWAKDGKTWTGHKTPKRVKETIKTYGNNFSKIVKGRS